MSTNINITVGDNALLDAAKQQQGANRQAQLQKEATLRLGAQATAARTTALAAQGRDANGNLITGASFTQPQIDRRPAASRVSSLPSFLLVPDQDFVADSIQAKTKSIKNKLFFCRLTNPIDVKPLFMSSDGPGNAPFLQSPQVSAGTGTYIAIVEFPVCDNDVLAIVENFPNAFKVLTSDGIVSPTQLKKPLHKLKEYTAEVYLKGDGTFSPVGTVRGSAEASIDYDSTSGLGESLFEAVLEYNDNITDESSYNYSLLVGGPEFFSVRIYFGSYSGAFPLPSGNYIWPEPLQATKWYHVALVKTETSQSIYLEGTLIRSVLSDFSNLLRVPDDGIFKANALLSNGGVLVLQPGIGGLRFTPKVLYTGPFTPPASITSLA